MTKRSRGVVKTRCKAMVNSTTPRLGPRCPPVCDNTLTSSSRTSCASCGRSCSRSALISAGERIPSRRRGAAGGASEESDFIILLFLFIDRFGRGRNLLGWLEIFHEGFARAIASDDVDFLFGTGQTLLTNLNQVHPFFVTHAQVFQRKLSGFHLLENQLDAGHSAI